MDSIAQHISDALKHFHAGDYAAMEHVCAGVLKLEPENVDALQMMGVAARMRGDWDGALGYLSVVARTHPHIQQVHFLIGHCLEAAGRLPEANESLQRAFALDPSDSITKEMYSQALMQQWSKVLGVRNVGRESMKTYAAKLQSGFIQRYLSGPHILDIGHRGHSGGQGDPIVPQAIGIDLNYPGYDGLRLPFADGSQDAVYSSHCLEHMTDPIAALRQWHRVLRVGGHIVAFVPHQHLYEKKSALPSRFNEEHKHFFTPATLLTMLEQALPPNSYRVRHLCDNDFLYDYTVPPERHPVWCYEIELVVEKIATPAWTIG